MTEPHVNGVAEVSAALPANWKQWLSRTRCIARLGLNHRQFDKLVDGGDLPVALKCPDGTMRWDPGLIDKLVESLEGGGVTLDSSGDPSKQQANSMAVATNHVERMVVLLEKPIHTAIVELRRSNADLRDELEATRERLELANQSREAMIVAREQLLSEQTARDIAARESASRDARKKQMFDIFAQRAPSVLDALGKTLGIAKTDQAKISAVIDLANDLDPAVLEGLVAAGLLTDKQVALVETILGKKFSRPKAEGDATPTEKATDAESQ